MPLLLKHPSTEALPPEAQLEVPHGTAGLIRVKRGQFLKVTDLSGGQPAALLAFREDDLTEFLSPHHMRVFSNSYVLTLGMRMVSNRRRPLMVLGRDTSRRHDLLLPASDRYSLGAAGLPHKTGSREAVQAALQGAGLTPPKLPDPINLFLDVAVERDGRLTIGPAPSVADDHIVCRVLIDIIVVVAACTTGIALNEQAGPLAIAALNALN